MSRLRGKWGSMFLAVEHLLRRLPLWLATRSYGMHLIHKAVVVGRIQTKVSVPTYTPDAGVENRVFALYRRRFRAIKNF
jgi:hypothetical protein